MYGCGLRSSCFKSNHVRTFDRSHELPASSGHGDGALFSESQDFFQPLRRNMNVLEVDPEKGSQGCQVLATWMT